MSKLDKKVEELKNEGWSLIGFGERKLNQTHYKFAVLEKEGKQIVINHQGGIKGHVSVLASRDVNTLYIK